jgi:2-polyprenyl-3-methyl-5-hydroxy-6-metoxy-1,4-benzoquinol methylase
MQMKSDKDDWDAHWNAISESASSNPAQRYRFQLIHDELERENQGNKNLCIVDLGCGNGDLISYSKENGTFEWIGIEPSLSGSIISKQKNPDIEIIQSDITQDKRSDYVLARADVVVCTEVIEHLDDSSEMILALSSKIKTGTMLLLTVPGGPRSKFDIHIGHRKHFTKRRLLNILEENGFEYVKIKQAGFPGHNLYKLVTILMGKRLIQSSKNFQSTRTSSLISRSFFWMMKKSLNHSIFGWQLIAVARKKSQ